MDTVHVLMDWNLQNPCTALNNLFNLGNAKMMSFHMHSWARAHACAWEMPHSSKAQFVNHYTWCGSMSKEPTTAIRAENYLQACIGTTFISFLRLFISSTLAFNTSYATGIRLQTSNPFLGGRIGFLGLPSELFFLFLAARLSSTIGTGKGFFCLFE